MVNIRGKPFKLRDDTSWVQKIVFFISEIIATFILMFLGCMGCVPHISGDNVSLFDICLAFGLAILIAIQCFGHISGGHVNPLVSIAAVLLGHLALVQLPVYIAGQMVGSLLGIGLLKLVTPKDLMGGFYKTLANGTKERLWGVCSPRVNPEIEIWQACIVEFAISFILVLVCAAIWDTLDRADSISIRFGLAVACIAMTAGGYTGAHMNPARSIGPSIVNNDWDDHWVYWVAPISGCVFASLFYRFVFTPIKPKEEDLANVK